MKIFVKGGVHFFSRLEQSIIYTILVVTLYIDNSTMVYVYLLIKVVEEVKFLLVLNHLYNSTTLE